MEFDRIIPHIGGFGRCHKMLVAFACLPNLLVALSFFSSVFLTLTPGHHCQPDPQLLPETLRNLSGVQLLNYSLPPQTDAAASPAWSRCRLLRYPSSDGRSRPLPNGSVSCTRGWQFERLVGLETNVVTQWNLVCKNYWKVPLEEVGYSIGWIVGFLTLGTVADGLGRRSTFVLSVFVAIIQHIGVLVSVDFIMFLVFHMLSGIALAGLFLSAYVARLEMCDPPHRLMIMIIAAFCTVAGEMLLPGLAELCKNWRILQGVVTAPFLILLIYWCIPSMFPESPRWLLATRRIGKCKQILRGIAIGNGVNVEDEIYTQCTIFNEMDSVFEEATRCRSYTFCDMTTAQTIWKNILILGFTTFIGNGIQHCFSQNLVGYSPRFYLSYFVIAGAEAVALIFLYFTVNKFGRRGILLFSTIFTGLSSLLLLALVQYLHEAVHLALSILGLVSACSVSILSIFFASEVVPTVVRGATLGLIMATGCIGKATSPIMDLHNKHGFFLHHVVFASFAVLSVLCIMLLPESKRKLLPESLKDGENQRRPPMLLSQNKDRVPLLHSKHHGNYNPENYSKLVTATKKMLAHNIPIQSQDPTIESVTKETRESAT
ncbi:putative solute carrier family 22 member 31 [Pristis pectinata]|uniref:putative solute carrier family 22 member 31 n=1 Tax=Pristis pectinata TaxID=685728 RepID=UPI00223E0556|nr:putative solute carrier family 22 member 31 [Pristis pectinata]XP_051883948.1 putative solute carrier family 22 member 31 [Pristis pectinata]